MISSTDTILRFLFCAILFLLMLNICMDIAIKYFDGDTGTSNKEYDEFTDNEGNHIYYDRAIRKKTEFHRTHPEVPQEQVRTWKRFFKEIIVQKIFDKQ